MNMSVDRCNEGRKKESPKAIVHTRPINQNSNIVPNSMYCRCHTGYFDTSNERRLRPTVSIRDNSSKRLISYLANKGSSSFSQNTVSVLVTGITFFRAEINLLLVWQGWPSSFVTVTITITTLLQITPDSPRVG